MSTVSTLKVPNDVTFPCAGVCSVPARFPLKFVAKMVPVEGLYVASPSDSRPKIPPSSSASAAKIKALPSFVLSLSVIDTAAGEPHAPAPVPSEVHTCSAVPSDVIKYSLFSTLLADNVPSARSVRSASNACLASNCV